MAAYNHAATTGQAWGLRNPRATRSAHVHDVSFLTREDGRVAVVARQCDHDTVSDMTREEARAAFRSYLRSGWQHADPSYRRITVDEFSRVECRRTA